MSNGVTYRTTPALVSGIVQTQEGVDLTPFIATGNMLTTAICGNYNPPYTDGFVGSQMELIERWLSGHFYTIYDNQLAAAKAGSVNVVYQTKIDFGLMNSMQGQQAMMLDTGGGLASWNNLAKTKRTIKISAAWLGKPVIPPGYPDWPYIIFP